MPPFPGMPYGPAPAWCFPANELMTYVFFVLCLAHALRSGRKGAVPYLLGGLGFGLILEYIEVLSHSYTYGHFWWMLGRAPLDIPLCIGCGWAIILYTSRLFSDAMRLRWVAAAALDTLLALNIDLSMDVVAYRLHMWHWYWNGTGLNPLTAQWFGIPYGNFVGWITVVFCYSFFSRLFERTLARSSNAGVPRFALIAVLALLCSQIVLFTTETWIFRFLSRHFGITSGRRLLLLIAVLLVLSIAGWVRREKPAYPIPALATWVPCWFHLFFIGCFFGFGFYRENRWMTVVAGANVLLGFAIHLLPLWQRQPILPVSSEAEKLPADASLAG
jgi:uncharacterized membrane protein